MGRLHIGSVSQVYNPCSKGCLTTLIKGMSGISSTSSLLFQQVSVTTLTRPGEFVPTEEREYHEEGDRDLPMEKYKPEQMVTVLRQPKCRSQTGRRLPKPARKPASTPRPITENTRKPSR